MDVIDIEAMLVRREAVFSQREAMDLDALDMLLAIIVPHEDVMEASRKRARETGPSALALRLAGRGRKRSPRFPKAYQARREAERKAATPFLDEILADLSR